MAKGHRLNERLGKWRDNLPQHLAPLGPGQHHWLVHGSILTKPVDHSKYLPS